MAKFTAAWAEALEAVTEPEVLAAEELLCAPAALEEASCWARAAAAALSAAALSLAACSLSAALTAASAAAVSMPEFRSARALMSSLRASVEA